MIDLSQYKTTKANKLFKKMFGPEGAMYKNIPMEYLEEVREYFKNTNLKIRVRYRGSRTNPADRRDRNQRMQDCTKQFADRFSVYEA